MKAPPKRALLIALVVLIAAGLVTRGYWQPPLLGLLGIEGDDGRYLGYVEGETSLVVTTGLVDTTIGERHDENVERSMII